MIRFEIDEQVANRLRQIIRHLRGAQLEDELTGLVENILIPEARALAPKRTGQLAASITLRKHGHDDHSAFVEMGTDLPYCERVEFGYKGPDALGRKYQQTGRFYMYGTYRGKQEEVVEKYARWLMEQCDVG